MMIINEHTLNIFQSTNNVDFSRRRKSLVDIGINFVNINLHATK